jgi:hypothetical protein
MLFQSIVLMGGGGKTILRDFLRKMKATVLNEGRRR